jgi:hypothetical protein
MGQWFRSTPKQISDCWAEFVSAKQHDSEHQYQDQLWEFDVAHKLAFIRSHGNPISLEAPGHPGGA